MHYQIVHKTIYTYSQPITLEPHTIRLRPRSDGWQTLQNFELEISPTPASQSQIVDLDGNAAIKVWFGSQSTELLTIQTRSQVETHCTNPFIFLLEPWANELSARILEYGRNRSSCNSTGTRNLSRQK